MEHYRAHQAREDAVRDERRRDRVCMLVRSLGGALMVRYDAPAGTCEALDTSKPRGPMQWCRSRATRHVLYTSDLAGAAIAYACANHAPDLAALADTTPYVTATAHPLPGPRPL